MKKLLLILFLVNLYGCCKDNPCQGAKEVKANFYAENLNDRLVYWMKPYWVRYDWKTQYTGGATFIIDSTVEWDSLEWHVGSEIIKNEKVFYRENFPDNSDIPITLIVWKKPNNQCFPKDDGLDTLTKVYHFTSKKDRLLGTYRGAFVDVAGRKDTFEFKMYNNTSINLIDTFPFTSCRDLMLFSPQTINETFGYAYGSTSCPDPDPTKVISSAYIRFLDNTSNQMELICNPSHKIDDPIRPKMTFRGYKK